MDRRGNGPIWIEDNDEDVEELLFREIAEVVDLTDEVIVATRAAIREPFLRTRCSYIYDDGTVVKPGMTLEIQAQTAFLHPASTQAQALQQFKTEFLRAEFFRIKQIVDFGHGKEPVFRGLVYSRAKNVENKFPKKLNEVIMIANVDLTDPRPWQDQALVDLKPSMFGRIRELRVTNASYPEFKYDVAKLRGEGLNKPGYIEKHGPLVCRHDYIRYFNGPQKKASNKPHHWAIVRVDEKGADDRYRKTSESLTKEWRGGRRVGGSYVPNRYSQRSPRTGLYPGQRYTTGDLFAGAGGVSRGMTMAGAHVVFAADNWTPAVESLKANFEPATKVFHSCVTDLVHSPEIDFYVDILHLSPPCQVWSPAHTRPGRNDDANEAILFSCSPWLKKLKPRLFTIEQTFGILHERFSAHFNRLIADFTEAGYSIRWQVVNLATFGVPQPRKRLIIIGAGPGEVLPEFPKPTHSLDARRGSGGLKPFVTVRQTLSPLAETEEYVHDHNPSTLRTPKTPWNPDRLLTNTITCNGGKDNYHWDGFREFSIAEFALLQGFPLGHVFCGTKTDKKRQIGNAFPSKVVRALYEYLMDWLDECDGIRERPKGLPPIGVQVVDLEPEPILVVDEDEDDDLVEVVEPLQQQQQQQQQQGQRRVAQGLQRSSSMASGGSGGSGGSGSSWDDPMNID
ncbi:S-adenosyl-L-methionine-dependent methyltransferase [Naviculisporaceae sp. PSN 640]